MIRHTVAATLLISGTAFAANPFIAGESSPTGQLQSGLRPEAAQKSQPARAGRNGTQPAGRQDSLPQVPIPQPPGAKSILPPGPPGGSGAKEQDNGEKSLVIIGIVNDIVAIKDTRNGDILSVRNRTMVSGPCFVDYPTLTCGAAAIELAKPRQADPAPAKSPARPAATGASRTRTVLKTITAITQSDDAISIKFHGGTPDYTTYRMGSPDRLVVDMKKTNSAVMGPGSVRTTGAVKGVRLGAYEDGVRMVIDLKDDADEITSAATAKSDTLTIGLKRGDRVRK